MTDDEPLPDHERSEDVPADELDAAAGAEAAAEPAAAEIELPRAALRPKVTVGLSQRDLESFRRATATLRAFDGWKLPSAVDQLAGIRELAQSTKLHAAGVQQVVAGLDAHDRVLKQQIADFVQIKDLYPDGLFSTQLADSFKALARVSESGFVKQLAESARIAASIPRFDVPVVKVDAFRPATFTMPAWTTSVSALSAMPDLRVSVLAAAVFTEDATRAFRRLNAGRQPGSRRVEGAFRRYVTALPDEPDAQQRLVVAAAGTGVAAVSATDLVVVTDPDLLRDPEPVSILDRFSDDFVRPWMNGPTRVRTALVAALNEIDDQLPELLFGAWHTIENRPPASLTTIANAGIELLDRSLRKAIPNDQLEEWIDSQQGQKGFSDLRSDRGRPTRQARIRYLFRERDGDLGLVLDLVATLVPLGNRLTQRLQGAKHAPASDFGAVRSYILTLEAVLVMIFASD